MKLFLKRANALALSSCLLALSLGVAGAPASAQVTAFKQAVAESASVDDAIATFYRQTGYAPLWTGEDDVHRARRAALFEALETAGLQGLPAGRYPVDRLLAEMRDARTVRDLGLVEAMLSRAFVEYATDLRSGVLVPARVDGGLKREVDRPDAARLLAEFSKAEPIQYLRALAPASMQYRALLKEKMRLEGQIAQGGWGARVPVEKLEPGNSGPAVVALRDRLIAMGFLPRSSVARYDDDLRRAVLSFQAANGLETDGVAGPSTITAVNIGPEERLKSVLVALERERWLPRERGERHILVNQTDFSARIVDHGQVTFQTRAVIGKNTEDRRSPEFSDVMEHMVINPSWYVPRSIVTKEYLPKLRRNPRAVGHLEITDSRGRRVSRNHNFSRYSARSFPFAMRQPPGKNNALGLVKFMFPNQYNIYLHDTPQKHLFAHDVRAYSHGCIRLAEPFEFAYALLARQEEDPKAFFHRVLDSGRETRVNLEQPVPVHLIYRTAWIGERGQAEYRRDVYERDAKIWEALSAAGVTLPAVRM
ncbi:murein L,D-transpeptidase [Lutimaribacter marinistellae]|uniref:Murein L,D-transpeptidase n=1 Tax=Lutimaribacter marinistellae TaxID=1820329 RepID=A0ABV7TLL1_9RHOB